jgi:hypothetical protein
MLWNFVVKSLKGLYLTIYQFFHISMTTIPILCNLVHQFCVNNYHNIVRLNTY